MLKTTLLGALLVYGASAGAAHARDLAALNACYPSQTLSAVPGEGTVAHGDRRFDHSVAPKLDLNAEPVPQPLRGSIRRVELPKGEKLVALTFDFCEQRGEVAGYAGGVFDTLRRENVPATLFMGGKWMRSHQTRTEQLMLDPLFEIANHSDLHRNMRKVDAKQLGEEVAGPARVYASYRQRLAATQCLSSVPGLAETIPNPSNLFRFPYGACDAASLNAVNDAGLLAIQWDVASGDPDPHQTADGIVSEVLRKVRPGSIIVAHANGRGWHTQEALPRLIAQLRERGYGFVTVSELLKRGKPVISESCYDRKPGDTDRYDFIGHALAHNRSTAGTFVPSSAQPSRTQPSRTWETFFESAPPPNRTHRRGRPAARSGHASSKEQADDHSEAR